MNTNEMYIEALKTFNDFVTIREWAEKFAKMYPNDFKKAEEKSESQKSSRSAIGEVTKSINASIINTKNWQLIVKEDKSFRPKKAKYLKEEERENKTINKKARNEKFVDYQILIEALEDVVISYDFPSRDNPKYTGNKGIEQIKDFEFTSCMIFEMASRNIEVIEIIDKLNYIDELKDKYPYLEYELDIMYKSIDKKKETLKIIDTQKYFPKPPIAFKIPKFPLRFKKFYESISVPILTKEIENEYTVFAQLPLSDFQNELEFLIDMKYSDNYNENWIDDMVKDGIDDPFKINEELTQQYKFKDSKGKKTIDNKYLSFGKLNIIIEYLQDRLKNDFYIYPNGYCQGFKENRNKKIVSKDFISGQIIQDEFKTTEISEALEDFRKLKPKDINIIADLFFMYDYYKKCQEDEEKRTYLHLDIKCLLTMHYGIEIKDTKELISYDICLERDDELKSSELGFYEVEKSIKNKIELMNKLINNKYYKYLLFR